MADYEHSSMSIADRFSKLRKDKGVSLREISKDTGIGATTLRHYESGTQPGFDNVIKLSEYFGVSLDYLAYGYKVHSYNGKPNYSIKEQIRSMLDNVGVFNMETGDYYSAKIYCPSYSVNKKLVASFEKSLSYYKEKIIDHFSNSNNNQLKEEMLVETLSFLIRERSLLECLALYIYSTDDNIVDFDVRNGAPGDIISTSETEILGRMISKLGDFKYNYYLHHSVSRKNKTIMFLED